MPADNTSIARRLIDEVWSNGTYGTIDDIVARDVIIHDPSMPDGKGTEELKAHVRNWRVAFPDLTCTCEEVLAAGPDRVFVRWTARGTHRGQLMTIMPTARSAAIKGCALLRFSNGKIAELNAYYDQLSLLQQLGVVQSMERIGKSMGAAQGARP